MAAKRTHENTRVVAGKRRTARGRAGGATKVDWRARVEPARVTEVGERRRVIKRATSRVKTTARVDTVTIDS